jgi:hypothetical protein
MLFKVTHINVLGHRRKAQVTAKSVADAMDQVDREWGTARALACVRLAVHPVLRVVSSKAGRFVCAA